MIILKTTIAKGIPEVAGTNKGHGEAGVKFVDAARKAIGLPDEKFFVSKGTRDYFQAHKEKLQKEYDNWEKVSFLSFIRIAEANCRELRLSGDCVYGYIGYFR